ncbi:MAG: hypothetical protein Q4C73_03800 [Eubacteriales bacterium]|nr:hypothetical protein [Eubacteriales bacterium]
MVAYFRLQNNLFMAAGAAAGMILAAAGYRSMILPAAGYAGIFIVLLFAFVGVVAGRVAAAVWANRRLRTLYGLLYEAGQPQQFLDRFEPLVKRVPESTIEYVDGMHHLAYACEALGRYDMALELLSSVRPEQLRLHRLVGTAQICNQRLRLQLLKRDAEKARESLRDLQEVQEESRNRAPAVYQNICECVRLAEIWLKALTGSEQIEAGDTEYIKEELSLAKNETHRREMQQLLDMIGGSSGNSPSMSC